jgi:thiol-disulfide isomerase/thioredoxin
MNVRNLCLGAALLVMSIGDALAADRFPYDAKAFAEALAAGKPILVHVTAPWCAQCKAQKPIVAALAARPEYAALTIFDVDFDTQKDALRDLNVQKQSTLVIYTGKAEADRAVGITRPEAIEALMRKAL